MSQLQLIRWSMVVAACAALGGCALLGKSEPVPRRYFTPESPEAKRPVDAPGAPARTGGPRLRLGRVTAWAHLRERLVVRTSVRELTYSENHRWTERPDVYLHRALAHALFEERGLTQVIAGSAPTLEVELIAFEELQKPRRGLFQALVVLHDERIGQLQETVTVEEPVGTPKDADQTVAVVEALARALQIGVARISDRVVARLGSKAGGG